MTNKELALENWVRLCEFCEQGIRMSNEANSLLDVIKYTPPAPIIDSKDLKHKYKCLSEVFDWKFVWLGALYCETAYTFDVVNAYYEDLMRESNVYIRPSRVQFQFEEPIISYDRTPVNLQACCQLEVLPIANNVAKYFISYITGITSVNKEQNTIMGYDSVDVVIPDPTLLARKAYDDTNINHKVTVTLVLPYTIDHELYPYFYVKSGVMFTSLARRPTNNVRKQELLRLLGAIKDTNR